MDLRQLDSLLNLLLSKHNPSDPLRVLLDRAEPLVGSNETARSMVLKILEEYVKKGHSDTYEALLAEDYIRKPVSISEFMTSKKYAGVYGEGLHPKWHEFLCRAFDPTRNYYEFIFTGAIGVGKTTVAIMCMLYKIYLLSCLRDCCNFYNLMKDSPIVFGLFNVYTYKADESYQKMQVYTGGIPYFKEVFQAKETRDKLVPSLIFPQHISVVTGANELQALGESMIGFLLDEANFMKGDDSPNLKGQAQKLYEAAYRRMSSRFLRRDEIPGLIILSSSRQSEESWLEKRLNSVQKSPGTIVASYARWEVKPGSFYSGRKFRVLVGDRFTSSRILGEEEVVPSDSRSVEFPIEHKREVEEDPEGALRDIAGISTVAESPLIHNRPAVYEAVDKNRTHPFTLSTFRISHLDEVPIERYFQVEKIFGVRRSILAPRVDPEVPRFVHVDIGLTGDSAGIAIGHITPWSKPESPFVYIDVMLRVDPPGRIGEQIDLEKIRKFIIFLRDRGMKIARVTYDGYQSAESIQMFQKLKIQAGIQSIDVSPEPYLDLRQAIIDKRISYYDYPPFTDELINLRYLLNKRKVDHPENGSKDTSDAVAGVVFAAISKGDLPPAEDSENQSENNVGGVVMPTAVGRR